MIFNFLKSIKYGISVKAKPEYNFHNDLVIFFFNNRKCIIMTS